MLTLPFFFVISGGDSSGAKQEVQSSSSLPKRQSSSLSYERELTVTFGEGALGLSVATDKKKGGLRVTKATGKSELNGLELGDEVVAVNGVPCRSCKSDEFKRLQAIVFRGSTGTTGTTGTNGDGGGSSNKSKVHPHKQV